MDASERTVILLDSDGVLLDTERYAEEWDRLAPRAFVPRLGGNPRIWADAQSTVWQRVEERANELLDRLPYDRRPTPADWWDQVFSDWIQETCDLVGVEAPASLQERVTVAEHAFTFYFTNTQAAFPGVGEALRILARECELHTASGNPSFIVECVLRQLGVRTLIGSPFGSDLLGSHKRDGARFYEAILASIGASAHQVIVVDDLEGPLQAAREVGATTVRIGEDSDCSDFAIRTIAELPALIGRLTSR